MIKYLTFIVIIILKDCIICSSLSDYLLTHYKLENDFSDSTGNFADIVNNGAFWTTGKNGTSNSAVLFTGNQSIVFPVSILSG